MTREEQLEELAYAPWAAHTWTSGKHDEDYCLLCKLRDLVDEDSPAPAQPPRQGCERCGGSGDVPVIVEEQEVGVVVPCPSCAKEASR